MDKQQGHAAWTEHAAWTYSMNMQQGHAAGTSSLDMQHRHAILTCSMDKQHGKTAWANSMDMQQVNAVCPCFSEMLNVLLMIICQVILFPNPLMFS
jgi:hypothetical protein